MYLAWTCKQTRQFAIVFCYTCRSKSSVKKTQFLIPCCHTGHQSEKKKMKKPGPLLCWMVCLLQEGPRKDKSKLKPQQSNKPFSLWQEAMIPHFFILKSLLAWLLAFFLFATCNDSSSFPRPVSFAQVKRKKEMETRFHLAPSSYACSYSTSFPLPSTLYPFFFFFSTCHTQEKADKAKKNTCTFFQLFPVSKTLQHAKQSREKKKDEQATKLSSFVFFFFSLGLKERQREWEKVTLLKSTMMTPCCFHSHTAFPEPIIIHTMKELSIWNFNLIHER